MIAPYYVLIGLSLLLFIISVYMTVTKNTIKGKHEKIVNENQGLLIKLELLEQNRSQLKESFEALSAQALERNNHRFLTLAQSTFEKLQTAAQERLNQKEMSFNTLVKPIEASLKGVDSKLQELEKERSTAYHLLKQQVSDLMQGQKALTDETANLVKALRTPHVRGRWGEIQLKRVIEMSGMSAHCDFSEQETMSGDQGRLRPDVIVKLPGGKKIIIDAKVPLAAYLDALEAKDEQSRQAHMETHAKHVRSHIQQLSKRSYFESSAPGESPEFVVLFLPGETFFTEALVHDPSLIEWGVSQHVIVTTPATLIALLHAVAYGWKQEAISQNAKEIAGLGQELYKRLCDMGGHISKLGANLNQSVGTYNKFVGSLESRVMPAARRFKNLNGSTSEQLEDLSPIDQLSRPLVTGEFENFSQTGDGQSEISLVKS